MNPSTHKLKTSSTYQLNSSSTYQLNSSSTYQLNSSSTYQLTNSSTYQLIKLKIVAFILQQRSIFHSVLAKLQVKKQVKSHYLQLLMPVVLSIFRRKTCILHHFAFLVWPKARNLSRPKTHFQIQKPYFLTTILPILAMCFMVL